jgi:pimeloyl-ACP methyl ester carboxylesterase
VARDRALLHGHEVAYQYLVGDRSAGTPVVVLVHGVGASVESWGDIPHRLAAAGHPVLALDLLGHGESGPGHGDYSLGSQASVVRDLLDHLGHSRAHLVGHSLGGGVSLQFAYQFPERLESLTLVSSGGLGRDVGLALRMATLPGATAVLRVATQPRVVDTGAGLGRVLRRVGLDVKLLQDRTAIRLRTLQDPRRLAGFVETLRSVVGPQGQRVSAADKLATVDPQRLLIVWGERDAMIPLAHGRATHGLLSGSRLVVVPGADHHAHTHDPEGFALLLLDHLGRTVPA